MFISLCYDLFDLKRYFVYKHTGPFYMVIVCKLIVA